MSFLDFFKKKPPQVMANSVKELVYWDQMLKDGDPEKYASRYSVITSLFPEHYWREAQKVADIGSGPLSGVFADQIWPEMVAVDPLWGEYEKKYPNLMLPNVQRNTGVAEDLPQDGFDLIWAVNSLDHSGNLEVSIKHIISCLKPGGRFLMHLHMRTEAQLNKAHRMVVTEEEVRALCSWEWVKVEEGCPIEVKPYRTFLGVHVH